PDTGWRLVIAGAGPLAEQAASCARDPKWQGKVTFSAPLSADAYARLLKECHAGLNCQRISDPISSVTFPSKLFTYLASGLLVVSSKASNAEQICGQACLYYNEESPRALAAAITEAVKNYCSARDKTEADATLERYSIEGTAQRVRHFLEAARS